MSISTQNNATLKNQYLRYGYGVALQSSGDKKIKFYLGARGKHSSQVYFLKETKPLRTGHHLYNDLSEMTFTIRPQLSFDANLQYEESKSGDLKRQLFYKRKKNEDELNQTTIKEAFGKPVKLGDMIQLYHPVTDQYLEFSIVKGDSGMHNIVTLTGKTSKQIQFRINSPLTFRKKGTPILFGDELYLASQSQKSLVYCNSEKLMNKLVMNFEKSSGSSWFGIGGVSTDNFRVPHVAEFQNLMLPVQAGNLSLNSVGGEYSNKIKFLSLTIPEKIEKERTSFKWGDIVILSKLENSGEQNLMFSQCNSSSYVDTLLFEKLKNLKMRELRGFEHFFQLTPKKSELFGEIIQFDQEEEVKVFLKHVLTGKFVFFDNEKKILTLSQDFGKCFDTIKSRSSSLKSDYKSKLKIYNKILSNDKIKNKELEIRNNFTNQEVKMFKGTDSIIESEERYIDQYFRDITLVLKKVSYGESKDLQTSSYFTIKSFSGDSLRVENNEENFKKFMTKKKSKDKYFKDTYDYKSKFTLEFPMICREEQNPDFFFFDRNNGGNLEIYRTSAFIIPDLINFLTGELKNKKNLATLKKVFEFLEKQFFNKDIDRTSYQHFLRESSIIDLLMAILQKIEDSSLEKSDEETFVPFFNKVIKTLQMICYNNKTSSEYLYQWKPFFSRILEEKITFGDQFILDKFVSEIFEVNENYKDYMQIKLEPLCNKLLFTNYDSDKLKLLISMLSSSRRLQNTKLDEYIVDTLMKEKNRKKLFFKFMLDENDISIFDYSKNKVFLMNDYTIDAEQEKISYIIDLVKIAATLAEMAPTKISGKLEELFPKDVCLRIIADDMKPGDLRGEFLKLFKTIYVDSHVRKYELSVIESYIKVDGKGGERFPDISKKDLKNSDRLPLMSKTTSFGTQRENWIFELRDKVLQHENTNLIELVIENLQGDISDFTEATMDFALYLLSNDLLKDEESQMIDVALKDILIHKRKKFKERKYMKKIEDRLKKSLVSSRNHSPNKNNNSSPNKLKLSAQRFRGKNMSPAKDSKRSANYLASSDRLILIQSEVEKKNNIPLQRKPWVPNLFRCLIQIESLKNRKRRQEFLEIESKKLRIDSKTLVKKLAHTQGGKRTEQILSNRKVTKDYMDGLTNSDPEILAVVVELLNPELDELTEIMLEFMDMQIRRDEIIMRIYKKKYELVEPPLPLISDFNYFYSYAIKMKRSALQIVNYMNENMTDDIMLRFNSFSEEMTAILKKIYIRIDKGDSGKKLNEYFTILEDGALEIETDDEIDGFVDPNIVKGDDILDKHYYFNIMNRFIGNTQFYSQRKKVFEDLKIFEDVFTLFLKLDVYIENGSVDFKAQSEIMMQDENKFEISDEDLDKCSFSKDYANSLIKSLLLFNYIFMKPSKYAESFMKRQTHSLIKMFDLVMNKGGKFIRSLYLKFISSIIRDNYSFLLNIDSEFLEMIFKHLNASIKKEDHQLTLHLLDILSNMIKYRSKIIIENSKLITFRIFDSYNSYGSKLRKLMTTEVISWLKNNKVKTISNKFDLSQYHWNTLHSQQVQFLEMTSEKSPMYQVAKVNDGVVIAYKILDIFNHILGYKDQNVRLLVKNSISLSLLQDMFTSSGEWYFMKEVILNIVKSLYVSKSMNEREINFVLNGIVVDLSKDLEKFRKYEENGKISDSTYFVSELISFEKFYFEDTVYKPYFEKFVKSKGNSWKEYITIASTGLMWKLILKPKYTKNIDTTFVKIFRDNFKKLNAINNEDLNEKEDEEIFITKKAEETVLLKENINLKIPLKKNRNLLAGAQVRDSNRKGIDLLGLTSERNRRKKKMKSDDSLTRGRDDFEIIKDDCISELILVENIYQRKTMGYKVKKYQHLIDRDIEKIIRNDNLFELKDEVFPNDYLSTIVDADYNEFVDASLKRFSSNKEKYNLFLKGMVELFNKKHQNYESLKRKIDIVKKLIERDENIESLMKKISEYGLYDKLIERYKENQGDKDSCLAIVDLIIYSVQRGRIPVQKAIFGKFGHEVDNGFLNAVSRNLDLYFKKFVEREYIRAEFKGYYRAGDIQKKNVKNQIEDALQYLNDHLELLRVFCEGHYQDMQEYLKFQVYRGIIRQNQVDMLEQIAGFLKQYSKIMNKENIKLGQKILDFFVEVVQGPCKSNQVELSKSKVPDILEEMSTSLIYEYPDVSRTSRSSLLNSMILILLGLLENTKQELIINKVSLNTNIESLWERLCQAYAQIYNEPYIPKDKSSVSAKALRTLAMGRRNIEEGMENKKKKKNEKNIDVYVDQGSAYSQEIEEALNITILFSQLKTLNKSFNRTIELGYNEKLEGPNKKLLVRARKFFFEKIRSIEIINQEEELQKIFFSKPPLSRFHSNFSKETFEQEVERGSSNEKLNGLIDNVEFLKLELEYFNKLSKGSIKVNFSIFFVFQRINFFFALILNLLFMILPDIDDEKISQVSFKSYNSLGTYEKICYIAAWVLLASYFITLFFWMYFSCGLKRRSILLHEKNKFEKDVLDGETKQRKGFVMFFVVSWKFLTDSYLINILFLIFSTFMGLFYSKFFFSFLLLDIVTISPSLKNIQKSIMLNTNSLIVTVSFILILVFGFSSITYFTKLRDNYVFLEDDTLNLCVNYFQCFITLVNFGVRSGGGIGDLLLYPNFSDDKNKFMARTIFDYFFFAIIVMILLSIVGAIIIDSFTELREIRDEKDEDRENKCFICDIDKEEFVKENLNFNFHRNQVHNHWDYFYYLIYLQSKEREDLNGFESYVLNKYEKGEISWFPIGQAIALKEFSMEDEIEDKLEKIEEDLEKLVNVVKSASK